MHTSIKTELIRKFFHIFIALIPIIYLVIGKIVFFTISLIIIVSDYHKISILQLIINKFGFNKILRKEEESGLTGLSYMLLSWMICISFFDYKTCLLSFLILAISDAIAAIVGKLFGKHKIFSKSLEGSLAFFITSLLPLLLIKDIEISAYIFAAFIATLAELFSEKLKINDNLLIPISFCTAMLLSSNINLHFLFT